MKTGVAGNICAGYLRQAATDARAGCLRAQPFDELTGVERLRLKLPEIVSRHFKTRRADYFFQFLSFRFRIVGQSGRA